MTETVGGWTLALISISVVFISLIILYGVYSFSGALFSGKLKRKRRVTKGARVMGNEEELAAAIGAALSLYLEETDGGHEAVKITMVRRESPWGNKSLNFRKSV